MTHLRAILAVLTWPCRDWHHPGDDECFAADDLTDPELVWRWADRIPERWWGRWAW